MEVKMAVLMIVDTPGGNLTQRNEAAGASAWAGAGWLVFLYSEAIVLKPGCLPWDGFKNNTAQG